MREIEVQKLAARIEAELASGRADDADLSDEQAEKVADVLRPEAPVEMLSRVVRAVAASRLVPTFLAAVGCSTAMAS